MHSDLNETFCVGNVNTKTKNLVKAAHDSLWAAIDMCKPGALLYLPYISPISPYVSPTSLWAAIDMCKPGKQRTVGW